MIQKDMLLGNGAFATVEGHTNQKVWSVANTDDIVWEDGVPEGEGARVHGSVT